MDESNDTASDAVGTDRSEEDQRPTVATRRKVLAGALAAGGVSALALGLPEEALASAPTDWYNVKVDYNAKGDGSTDDTTAISNAISAANSNGGGVVYFPPGTYITGQQTLYSQVYLLGAGPAATVLQLKNSANTNLLQSYQFSSLTGTNQEAGPTHFGIFNLSLNGNKTNNTSGDGLEIYGSSYRIQNVNIHDFPGRGIYSEWASGGTDMEAHLYSFKVYNCGGDGIDWNSPHDSVLHQFQVFNNGSSATGIWINNANGAGTVFIGGHVWGTHTYAWRLEWGAYLIGCEGEGASSIQCYIRGPDGVISGCHFFGGNGYGIQFGATNNNANRWIVDMKISNCPSGGINFISGYEQNNIIHAHILPATGASAYVGTPHTTDSIEFVVDDGSGDNAQCFHQHHGATSIGSAGTATGFFGSSGTTKPTITGSKSGNAALASLITALANLGLVTDSTT